MTLRESLRRAIVAHARRYPELHTADLTIGGDHQLERIIGPRTQENADVFDGGKVPYKPGPTNR